MKVAVSIITTLYKGEKYIHKLVEMIKSNAIYFGGMMEYIIVNDYPDQNIPDIESRIPNLKIRIYQNKKNVGIHKARVIGLEIANGEYVTFLDQDDEIGNHFVQSQYRKIGLNDVIVCNGYKELEHGRKLIYRDRLKHGLIKHINIYLMAADQIVSPGHCLIKKSAIPKMWYKNILERNGADDLYLWILMLEKDRKFIANSDRLYIHKKSGNNLSDDLFQMSESINEVLEIWRKSGVSEKNIMRRKRLENFVLNVQAGRHKGMQKVIDCILNPDIVILKIFAYYI